MKIGELAEYAIWVDGTETEAMLRQWKADVGFLISSGHEPKLNLGPITFEIKRPGDDRVPQVPDSLSGPNVRLLIATAEVLRFETTRKASFVDDLDKKDLLQLRAATRQAHGRHLPDNVCDQIIDRLGPVAGAATFH